MALATVPYPPNCSVAPWDGFNGVILCPDTPSVISYTQGTLVIRNQANNPIQNASVIITFLSSSVWCFCGTMTYTTTTDNTGTAYLTLRGGGCIQNTDQAAVIKANGVVIRDYYNAKSPDWDGVAGNCHVAGPDAVRFAGVPKDLCFDFNNTGLVEVADYVVFVSGLTPSHNC